MRLTKNESDSLCGYVLYLGAKTQDKKEDKEHGKPPKNSKRRNYKHCWTKMIRKHDNNLPSNWALVNKLFPLGYERWERFRRLVDEYHMS